jgi:Na+/H+-dicarboxylate symporter
MFMDALKMIIIPLILTSIISGVTNIGSDSGSKLGKMGIKTFAYYFSTSIFAILVGVACVNIIEPGVGAQLLGSGDLPSGLELAEKGFGSTLQNIIPTNIFKAFYNQDMLSIIFFAILCGVFIMKLEKDSQRPLVNGVNAAFDLMMKITDFILKFAPIGVFGLVANTVAGRINDGDFFSILQELSWYAFTVVLALFIHAFIVLPILLLIIGKINPIKYIKSMKLPLLTAFSTASSSATLPLTLEAAQKHAGISTKTSSFVLPLGATVNMDGTALYECVAVIFVAQAVGMPLDFSTQALIVLTALMASIGAAGIPMAGLVMMTIIFDAIGIDESIKDTAIVTLLVVDRPLDMCRTAVNVWSDSCGTAIIAKSEGETLKLES